MSDDAPEGKPINLFNEPIEPEPTRRRTPRSEADDELMREFLAANRAAAAANAEPEPATASEPEPPAAGGLYGMLRAALSWLVGIIYDAVKSSIVFSVRGWLLVAGSSAGGAVMVYLGISDPQPRKSPEIPTINASPSTPTPAVSTVTNDNRPNDKLPAAIGWWHTTSDPPAVKAKVPSKKI